MLARLTAILLACYLLAVSGAATRAGDTFSWQEPYAKVLPQGDLEWDPKALPLRERRLRPLHRFRHRQ